MGDEAEGKEKGVLQTNFDKEEGFLRALCRRAQYTLSTLIDFAAITGMVTLLLEKNRRTVCANIILLSHTCWH